MYKALSEAQTMMLVGGELAVFNTRTRKIRACLGLMNGKHTKSRTVGEYGTFVHYGFHL